MVRANCKLIQICTFCTYTCHQITMTSWSPLNCWNWCLKWASAF